MPSFLINIRVSVYFGIYHTPFHKLQNYKDADNSRYKRSFFYQNYCTLSWIQPLDKLIWLSPANIFLHFTTWQKQRQNKRIFTFYSLYPPSYLNTETYIIINKCCSKINWAWTQLFLSLCVHKDRNNVMYITKFK